EPHLLEVAFGVPAAVPCGQVRREVLQQGSSVRQSLLSSLLETTIGRPISHYVAVVAAFTRRAVLLRAASTPPTGRSAAGDGVGRTDRHRVAPEAHRYVGEPQRHGATLNPIHSRCMPQYNHLEIRCMEVHMQAFT